jgi:hypothetical protein
MRYFIKVLAFSSFILFVSCAGKENAEPLQNNAALFRQIPGAKEFEAGCITCHSLRYIEMQPPFPRKSWEKIVDKMVKNFGAPISDSTAKVIVDYLVEVKGVQ